MTAAMIFVISFLALLQFFVSYGHSVVAASREHELSEEAREICGLTAKTMAGDQFRRLMALIALCPEPEGGRLQVRVVALYFHMLGLARTLLTRAIPSAESWIETERGGCAYAVAVVLDRRIAYNRMMTQQANQ
jgi:hypothetical protein